MHFQRYSFYEFPVKLSVGFTIMRKTAKLLYEKSGVWLGKKQPNY